MGKKKTGQSAKPELSERDLEAVERLREAHKKIRAELSRVIVGQDKVIDELLISIFSRGHGLLVGVPGLAKTLMIHSLADCLSLPPDRRLAKYGAGMMWIAGKEEW